MNKLISVKYFHRDNLDKDILRCMDRNEKVFALEIYFNGQTKWVAIKDVVDYISSGEDALSQKEVQEKGE